MIAVLLAATLTWTMPTTTLYGDTLAPASLDWQAAYAHASRTWADSGAAMCADSVAWARLWPRVAAEMEPVVLASGQATPGAHVSIAAPPVASLDWPFSYFIRTRQRPAGRWSGWSNPQTRADNQ